MKTIKANEAEARFRELLEQVENGETIIVIRDGQPVAQVSPVPAERTDGAAAVEELRRYRQESRPTLNENDAAAAMEEIHRFRREFRPTLGRITIRELIEEGRE